MFSKITSCNVYKKKRECTKGPSKRNEWEEEQKEKAIKETEHKLYEEATKGN